MNLDQLCVNTIRMLAIDAVQKADSGHPGLPLGAAPMAYVLFQKHLRQDPETPSWPDRDRFVLSAGHGSMLIYALLHLYGYDLTMEDIQQFRQWGSRTPGHPEYRLTPGVEATTGPLGQGTANAVGMAIAERSLAHTFNRPGYRLVDHYTFALVSDGDLMEGVSSEAASLAGHLKLGRLIYLYDSNAVSLDGPTSMAFSEDVAKRFEASGWQVLEVQDGNADLDRIDRAIRQAKKDEARPSLIVVHTTIGYGSPNKQGTSSAHGSPLGPEEVALTKKALGWDPDMFFHVPAEARMHFEAAAKNGAALHESWERQFEAYAEAHPELAREWERRHRGELPKGWDAKIPSFEAGTKLATRQASGKVIQVLAAAIPELIGGDADLSVSTNTTIAGEKNFDGSSGAGRNIRFGVREHVMGGAANGIAYHGGLRIFVSTFFCFSDYMRPAVRLAALSELATLYVWTHDSIGLGEDGPTHQPIEHLMSLRAMPHLWVIRPADANETAGAWHVAMRRKDGPVALVLSRQGLPVLDARIANVSNVERGAYVLEEASHSKPSAILIATGSEVSVALAARTLLEKQDIATRVVSMPCWEAFEAQQAAYRDSVLPPEVTVRVSVEAGATLGWERWVGSSGASIGLSRFGASSPGNTNFEKLGMTAERVADAARALLRARN